MLKHTLIPIAAVVAAAALTPPVAHAAGKTETLRFFDKTQSITLTHADGTVLRHEPLPDPVAGDTLDVYSLDYAGSHSHHAARFTASNHLRCVFGTGEPTCESHLALGGSLVIFDGNPGTVVGGTGRYLGASGRVISSKEVSGGSDVVARVKRS